MPGLVCLLLTPALLYVLYPPEVKDTPDAPAKVRSSASGLHWSTAPHARHLPWVIRGPPNQTAPIKPPPQAKEELAKLGPMSTDEKLTAFAFAVTVGLW